MWICSHLSSPYISDYTLGRSGEGDLDAYYMCGPLPVYIYYILMGLFYLVLRVQHTYSPIFYVLGWCNDIYC